MTSGIRPRTLVLAALGAALIALAHCTGGQSGHEGAVKMNPNIDDAPNDMLDAGFGNCGRFGNCPGDTEVLPPCACQDFIGRSALAGVVTAFAAPDQVEIQIREVLSDPECSESAAAAGISCPFVRGEVLRARWDGQLACAALCAGIEAGEDVIALYDGSRDEVALLRARDEDYGDRLDLGAGRVFDEEVPLLTLGGAPCMRAVEAASGAQFADAADTSLSGASDAGQEEASDSCPLVEVAIDAGPPPALKPPFLGHADACAGDADDAPIDCLDVCGALHHCDGTVACGECMSQCLASPETWQGFRCLSYAIYAIDEEGCERMVPEYRAFAGYECPGLDR